MRIGERVALGFAALVLAAYAGLAVWAGAQLTHTGAQYLYATAAILTLGAVGVALGQLWGRAFALLFFVATALLYGYLFVEAARGALTDTSGGEWAPVRRLVVGVAAVLLLAAFVASATLGVLAARFGRRAGGEGVVAHTLAWPFALAGVAAVAWMVGYQYHYRLLREQNACLAGGGLRCYQLARESERFSAAERLRFTTRGCENGHTGSCNQLAGQLGPAHPASSPEASLLAAVCSRGNADVCLRLGAHLLKIGDKQGGSRSLSSACETTANRCTQAAELAEARGEAALTDGLLRRGCERDEPYSCRALLRRMQRGVLPVPQAELGAFQLRVCLITDVNDCLTLIRKDAAAVCPVICQGESENRKQSCDHCGRHAAQTRRHEQALEYFGGNCERGYPLSCVNLGVFLQEQGDADHARTWFRKACDRSRNLTLGCQHLEAPRPRVTR